MRFCWQNRAHCRDHLSMPASTPSFNSDAGDVRTMMHQTGSRLIHSLKITAQTSWHYQWLAGQSLLMTTSGRYVIIMSFFCSQERCRVGEKKHTKKTPNPLIIPSIHYKNRTGHGLASNQPCILVHRCHFQPPPPIRISQLGPVE